MIPVILASASPSRHQVLRSAGIHPQICVSGVDEEAIRRSLPETATPEEILCALALAKAQAVYESQDIPTPSIIIGADSMLLIQGELIGKPHTADAAVERWEKQSGQVAQLLTGHCLIYQPSGEFSSKSSTVDSYRCATFLSESTIHFGCPSEEDIRAYVATGEPLGCAGAFTLEARGGWFIDRIEGDPSGVLGLSLPATRSALEKWDITISQLWAKVN